MAGTPTITEQTRTRIRKLAERGFGKKAIAELVGCSIWTVRKTLQPDFQAKENARHRKRWPVEAARRAADPKVRAYQIAYGRSEKHKTKARIRMRLKRALAKIEARSA